MSSGHRCCRRIARARSPTNSAFCGSHCFAEAVVNVLGHYLRITYFVFPGRAGLSHHACSASPEQHLHSLCSVCCLSHHHRRRSSVGCFLLFCCLSIISSANHCSAVHSLLDYWLPPDLAETRTRRPVAIRSAISEASSHHLRLPPRINGLASEAVGLSTFCAFALYIR